MSKMSEQEIQLLMRDVSARFPYGVVCQTLEEYQLAGSDKQLGKLTGRLVECGDEWCNFIDLKDNMPFSINWGDFRPCLRRMTSMTDEEKREYEVRKNMAAHLPDKIGTDVDYLLENHFDFHGMIIAGIGVEVTNEFNPYR